VSATDNALGREVPSRPKWRGDSKELYYVAPNRKLMAVQILPATSSRSGSRSHFSRSAISNPTTTITRPPDGQRFLVKLPIEPVETVPIHLILHWDAPNASR
jgi:hypothetical protein